jgi:hypothetical protein
MNISGISRHLQFYSVSCVAWMLLLFLGLDRQVLSPRTGVLRVLCLLIGFCLLQYIFVELEWARQKVSAPIDSRTEYQVNSLSR